MNPDELRREANRLRLVADLNGARGWENNAESCRRGADALDRLADVIAFAEADSHQLGMSDGYAEALRDILRLARGETNERESSA